MQSLRFSGFLFLVFALCAGCGSSNPSATAPSSAQPTPTPPPTTGIVQGTLRDFDTNAPIAAAIVEVGGVGTVGATTTTDAKGGYRFELTPRQFSITAFRGDPVPGGRGYEFDYLPASLTGQQISAGDTLAIDFALKTRLLSTAWTVTGLLVDRFAHPIADARIYVHDPVDSTGYLSNRPDLGLYGTATADKTGRFTVTSRVRVEIPTIRISAYWGTVTPPVAEKDIPCCGGDVFLASPLVPENH
jgi:hypothetical protein